MSIPRQALVPLGSGVMGLIMVVIWRLRMEFETDPSETLSGMGTGLSSHCRLVYTRRCLDTVRPSTPERQAGPSPIYNTGLLVQAMGRVTRARCLKWVSSCLHPQSIDKP